MLEALIQKSAGYLIGWNVIDPEDRDVYEYGFHVLYSNAFIFSIIGFISVLTKQLPVTIMYHFAFIIMRNSAGGYHAATRLRCFCMSTAIWLISLRAINSISSFGFIIGMSLFSMVLVWLKAPIEHENNPMDNKKFTRMKIRSRSFSVCLFIIVVFLCFLGKAYMWAASALAAGMFSHALLLAITLCVSHLSKGTPK